MQMDISNKLNASNTNVKDIVSSELGSYRKSKSEDKFGTVLQKEKQNLSSNETKELVISKIENYDLKDTSSVSEETVKVKIDLDGSTLNSDTLNIQINDSVPDELILTKDLNMSVSNSNTDQEKAAEVINNLLSSLGNGDDNVKTEITTVVESEISKEETPKSKDDILNYLAAIVELINKIELSPKSTYEQNANLDRSTLNSETLNIQINDSVPGELILTKDLNISVSNSNTDQEKAVEIINNLLSILKNGDDKELLNKQNLTTIQGLLNELGVKLDTEVGSKDIKAYDILNELVKNAKTEVVKLVEDNTMVESKTAKETLQNNIVDKGLALKEETPKIKNVELTSTDKFNEINYAKGTTIDENLTDSGKDSNGNSSSTLKSEISKEEKLLSSILEDGDEKVDNKFASIVDRLGIKTTTPINVETQVVNKESIAADVVKSVKFMVTNNMKEMTVKINPEQLGEITIKVIEEGGTMKAILKASSKETYTLLSQQVGDIKKHLGEQNIKIQEVNISIYDEDATFYKDGQFSSNSSQDESNNRQKNRYVSTGEFSEEELNDNSELYEEGNINMLA